MTIFVDSLWLQNMLVAELRSEDTSLIFHPELSALFMDNDINDDNQHLLEAYHMPGIVLRFSHILIPTTTLCGTGTVVIFIVQTGKIKVVRN